MQNKTLVIRMSKEDGTWMEYDRYVLETDSHQSLKERKRNRTGYLKWCPEFQARMDTRKEGGVILRDFLFWQAENQLLPLKYVK